MPDEEALAAALRRFCLGIERRMDEAAELRAAGLAAPERRPERE